MSLDLSTSLMIYRTQTHSSNRSDWSPKPMDWARARTPIVALDTMGRHFGDLAKIRHVITYSLSPFEQRAFPNYFSKGIPNVWRRFTSSVFKVAPPMICMYLTYTWGNHVHSEGKRKVAADYENEE